MRRSSLGFLCILLTCTLMLGTFSPALAATEQTSTEQTIGVVTATELNVRDARSTSAKILFKLKKGDKVTILNSENKWYQIQYEKKTGYASADYIQLSQKASEEIPAPTASQSPAPTETATSAIVEATSTAQPDVPVATATPNADALVSTAPDAPVPTETPEVPVSTAPDALVSAAPDALVSSSPEPATETPSPSPVATGNPSEYTTLRSGSSGPEVARLQERLTVLKYYSEACDGNYGKSTVTAVKAFQKNAGLTADGVAGPLTQAAIYDDAAPDAASTPMPSSNDTDTDIGDYTPPTPKIKSVSMPSWWDSGSGSIQSSLPRKSTAVVTDVKTGISFTVYRMGGTNHADVEPLTKGDTQQMRKLYSSWSWTRRAVWVTTSNGQTFAGSINGMPHGDATIANNNFNGHFCIHFYKSRTHGSNSQCALHQAAVKSAYETGAQRYGDGTGQNVEPDLAETEAPSTEPVPGLVMEDRDVLDIGDMIDIDAAKPTEEPASDLEDDELVPIEEEPVTDVIIAEELPPLEEIPEPEVMEEAPEVTPEPESVTAEEPTPLPEEETEA